MPKDPDSKAGEFETMVDWLNHNIIDKANDYDEYQILGHSSKVTITLKICCYGYKPVRTDGKKELKAEAQSETGLVWKYLFYDKNWERYGSAKRSSSVFSNGLVELMRANRNFKEDLIKGYFGPETPESADDETSFVKYKFYTK